MYVHHWGASIVGGIQPGPVRRLMGQITDDGLVARFLVAHCEKKGEGTDREPDGIAVRAYHNVIKTLTELKPKSETGTETFRFTDDAQEHRHRIRDTISLLMVLPDTGDALKGHLNKFEGQFCRLALVYHLIEAASDGHYPDHRIQEHTAKMAADMLLQFLLPNSIRFFNETIGDGGFGADARWVAGYILAEGIESIARRDLQMNYRRFRRNPSGMTATMALLTAAGWVDEASPKRNGEATAWAVNPTVHTRFTQLAEQERTRRAAERVKIQEAIEKLRRAGGL